MAIVPLQKSLQVGATGYLRDMVSCGTPYSAISVPVCHSLSVGVQDLVHGVRHKREAHVVQVLKQAEKVLWGRHDRSS